MIMTLDTRAITIATVVGSVLQSAMVLAGHTNPRVAALFAVGGMGISLAAGVLCTFAARGSVLPALSSLAVGGLIAGAVCAFVGIVVSYLLGDVPASLLVLGTASSAVTGALGGMLGKLFQRERAVAAA